MTPERRAELEAAGYSVGDAADFFGLDEEQRKAHEERAAQRRAARQASEEDRGDRPARPSYERSTQPPDSGRLGPGA